MQVWFLVLGILSLICLPIVIWLYTKKIKRGKIKSLDDDLNIRNNDANFIKHLAVFWNHVIYLLIIFTLLVAAIVLIAIAF